MNHLAIGTILLPAFTGILLILLTRHGLTLKRGLGLVATTLLVALTIHLLIVANSGIYQVYELGAWPAPFGIVLVLDRLSAYMLLLTAIVALCSLLFALQGWDTRGKNFHAIFQFQLMGLNIAFLTGDIFNLFVAFEILLIASYGLLLHGGGAERIRAGLHYVIINLAGSALFLIAVGLIYGVTGTLNMADLAVKTPQLPAADIPLLQAGGLLLLAVFAIKAALLPLYFWLPGAYSAATPPVAALFSLMTKVGVYSIIRVYTLIFGTAAGPLANLAQPYLLPAALATLALGMLGAISARELRHLIAYLTVASVGTLLTAVGLCNPAGLSAALYYTAHSTLVTAALFLLAGLIAQQRGTTGDRLHPGPALAQPALLGVLFCALAIAAAGLPPLSGFLGKLLIMTSAIGHSAQAWAWTLILVTSLLGLIGLSRAGSLLFWKTAGIDPVPASRASALSVLSVVTLLGLLALMTLLAGPLHRLLQATAVQLYDSHGYVDAVLRTPRALEAMQRMGTEADR
jgi:multicomponent K+:H+ antiporter subunit D